MPDDDLAPTDRPVTSRFRTAAEFAASVPEVVPWVWDGYVARGALTLLSGKIKSSGKTTLLLAVIRGMLDGLLVAGRPTAREAVVFATEQPATSLREALARARLLDREDLHLLSLRDARDLTWPETVFALVQRASEVHARVLVVDTLGAFTRLADDAENDAGAALAAMGPLVEAAEAGLAVVVSAHDRKTGGFVGDSLRGSSAIGGAADIVLQLAHVGDSKSRVRRLTALSRFDATPDELMVALVEDGTYAEVDPAAIAASSLRVRLVKALKATPHLAVDAIVSVLSSEAKTSRPSVSRALDALLAEGRVVREGTGKPHHPYLWSLSDHATGGSRPGSAGKGPTAAGSSALVR